MHGKGYFTEEFADGLKHLLDGEPLKVVADRTGLPYAWLRRVSRKGLAEYAINRRSIDERSLDYVRRLFDYLGGNCWTVGRQLAGTAPGLPLDEDLLGLLQNEELTEQDWDRLCKATKAYRKARAKLYDYKQTDFAAVKRLALQILEQDGGSTWGPDSTLH